MNSSEILNELRNLALKINPNLTEFNIHIEIDGDIGIELGTRKGIDIDLNDVSIDPNVGVWVYKGHHVLLFIPDQGWNFDEVLLNPEKGRKFHLTDCDTIERMRLNNRFFRYQATNNTEGIFAIYGKSRIDNQDKTGEVPLKVCKNCLQKLNYKNYARLTYKAKNEIYLNFNLDEFFKHYQTSFIKRPPNVGQDRAGYADDWKEISDNYKYRQYWTCEECRVNLSEHRQLLDTHHINGVKHHNDDSNLKALCKECHSKQPNHGHYYVSHDDKLKLQTLRKMQGLA